MITLILADDDAIIREGLKIIIDTQEDIKLLGVASNGEEAVKLCEEVKPEVALLDIRMPVMDGIEAATRMMELGTNTLLLTTFDEENLIYRALKSGISGYILKNSPSERILSSIRAVASGGTVFQKDILEYIRTTVREKNSGDDLFRELTEREREVVELVAKGLSNKEISEKLFISDGTVRNHISTVLDKTNLEHRTQIAIEYLKQN